MPNPAQAALTDIVDGQVFAGRTARVYYHIPTVDKQPIYNHLTNHEAIVQIGVGGGNQGHIDRTDRVDLNVYATQGAALDVAEEIREAATNDGSPLDLPSGYVDSIRCNILPHETPFPSEFVQTASVSFLVTTRLP